MAEIVTIKLKKWDEVSKNHAIVKDGSLGVKPIVFENRERFLKIVKTHRPYCSSDFKKQYFIPDLSNI